MGTGPLALTPGTGQYIPFLLPFLPLFYPFFWIPWSDATEQWPTCTDTGHRAAVDSFFKTFKTFFPAVELFDSFDNFFGCLDNKLVKTSFAAVVAVA